MKWQGRRKIQNPEREGQYNYLFTSGWDNLPPPDWKKVNMGDPCPTAPLTPLVHGSDGPVWNVRTVSAQAKSLNITAFLEYGDERLASFRGLEIRDVGKYLWLVDPRSLVSITSD